MISQAPQLVTSIPSATTWQGPGCSGRTDFCLHVWRTIGFWCLDVEESWIVRFAGGSSLTVEIPLSSSKDEAFKEPHS